MDVGISENDGIYDINYVFRHPGEYFVDVKFGGKNVPNGVFTIKVY